MPGSSLINALLCTYLATALVAFATRWLGAWTQRVVEAVHLVGITVALVFATMIAGAALQHQMLAAWDNWLFVDSLGSIFVGVTAVVGFLTGLYSIGYMRNDVATGEVPPIRLSIYYGFFHLFLFTMTLVVTSNNLVMMWVGIETTTLGSVFLVGFYGRRASLEAAWKYVVICTVGVAFGLYGTVLVFSNADAAMDHAHDAILWTAVVKNAAALDPAIISIAFVFILIGFGTKAGLFPMHAWLPDAHSEAPSPVSGLLSAGLLNCALLVIIRYAAITTKAAGPELPHMLFLIFGMLSIGFAALFIAMQRDVKRMLAYSSVENMGLIMLGLGLGGPLGVGAALLHVMNHSLAKTLMFCCSGNILMKYGTRDLDAVKGMLRVAPASGLLLMAGALALGGVPPFNVFISEFITVAAGVKAGYAWLMIVCLLLLTIVLAAFVRMIGGSILGPAPANMKKGDLGPLTLLPIGLVLALVLLMGVHVPAPAAQLIADASETVLGTSPGTVQTALSEPWTIIKGGAPGTNMDVQPRQSAEASGPSCVSIRTLEETTCPK
jgi:hydrogenase-4 component F